MAIKPPFRQSLTSIKTQPQEYRPLNRRLIIRFNLPKPQRPIHPYRRTHTRQRIQADLSIPQLPRGRQYTLQQPLPDPQTPAFLSDIQPLHLAARRRVERAQRNAAECAIISSAGAGEQEGAAGRAGVVPGETGELVGEVLVGYVDGEGGGVGGEEGFDGAEVGGGGGWVDGDGVCGWGHG